MTQLLTERLRLRPVAPDDHGDLLALDDDPEVMRFLTGGVPSSPDEITAAIAETAEYRWVAHRIGGPGGPGAFVGWFSVRPGPGPHDRELGYRLVRAAWGDGLATEGARAVLDHAFDALGAERVWAQTMAVNRPSRRVMERLGMRFVRVFHLEWDDPIEGTEHGEVEYELTRDMRSASTPR